MDKGCEWVGTVGDLEEHMVNCQFATVLCPRECKTSNGKSWHFMRKDLAEHLRKDCPHRPHHCEYCGKDGTHVFITQDHDKFCGQKIVHCPSSECTKTMPRQDTEHHIYTECQYAVVACKYQGIGCDVKVVRKEILPHEQNDNRLHLHLALDRVSELEKAVDTLLRENAELKSEKQFSFKVAGYEERKQAGKEYRSSSFYSGPRGYHVAIEVYISGYNEGRTSHLSVYAFMLKGKYDNELTWPFVGEITVTLLNQLENKNHFMKAIVVGAERNVHVHDNWGYPKFISNSKLGHDPVKIYSISRMMLCTSECQWTRPPKSHGLNVQSGDSNSVFPSNV